MVTLISNDDQIRDADALPYVKLHGCITHSSEKSVPLILTNKNYIEYELSREKLYARLTTDAYDYPIVFIGHNLSDQDILELICKVRKSGMTSTPKYYLVIPNSDQIQKEYWSQQKIEILDGTFEDFLNELNNKILPDFRGLKFTSQNKEFPIIDTIAKPDTSISDNLKRFLKNEVEYISKNLPISDVSAKTFYKGLNVGWGSIEQNLDVKRELSDDILLDNFLVEDDETSLQFRMPLIKAPAGTGKSVILKRIAWDAAFTYNKTCLFLNEYGKIDLDALKELLAITQKKIYLFIDNASRHAKLFYSLKKIPREDLKKLTLILAERNNEWNMNIDENESFPFNSYELQNLNTEEISNLIDLLAKHDSLGILKNYTKDEQIRIFKESYNKQLLVALYEATKGRSFEDIIKDEYSNILPMTARYMYLSICVLNRLNIPVRAGLIASIFNVNINDFKTKFFQPLEEIVYARQDSMTRDFYYEARHPYIAQIVFEQILANNRDRFMQYHRILSELNTTYDSDRFAFKEMIKANNLLELFNKDHELISQVYEIADKTMYNDPFLLQQKAIYEMKRPNPGFAKAKEYLSIAESKEPKSTSIKHSKAELYIKIAENIARTEMEMEQYLISATKIIDDIIRFSQTSSYCISSLIKIELIRLKSYIKNDDISQDILNDIISKVEYNILKGLQAYPNDTIILQLEAELAEILNNQQKLVVSLSKAFNSNNANTNLGIRLAKIYNENNDKENALKILDKAIDSNRSDTKLKYLKAKLLFEEDEFTYRQDIIYLLERSCMQNDKNYDGKLLLGREYFISGQYEKCYEIFEKLKDAYVSENIRTNINYPINQTYYGKVISKQSNYLFIRADNICNDIFAHINDSNIDIVNITTNDKVKFTIGFNFKGPVAMNVEKTS